MEALAGLELGKARVVQNVEFPCLEKVSLWTIWYKFVSNWFSYGSTPPGSSPRAGEDHDGKDGEFPSLETVSDLC